MLNLTHVMLAASPDVHVSTLARVLLFASAAMSIFIGFVMGLLVAAGPDPRGNARKHFLMVSVGCLLLHGGYLAAPWVVGRAAWPWAFWTMLPLAVLMGVTVLCMLPRVVRSITTQGAAFARRRLLRTGLFAGIIYLVPPLILWLNRPIPA